MKRIVFSLSLVLGLLSLGMFAQPAEANPHIGVGVGYHGVGIGHYGFGIGAGCYDPTIAAIRAYTFSTPYVTQSYAYASYTPFAVVALPAVVSCPAPAQVYQPAPAAVVEPCPPAAQLFSAPCPQVAQLLAAPAPACVDAQVGVPFGAGYVGVGGYRAGIGVGVGVGAYGTGIRGSFAGVGIGGAAVIDREVDVRRGLFGRVREVNTRTTVIGAGGAVSTFSRTRIH